MRAYRVPRLPRQQKEIKMKSNPERLLRFIKPSSHLRLRKFRPLTLVLALLIALSVLTVSAVATCNFLLKWTPSGTPRGVAVDSSGNVYVPDSGNHVQKFDSSGTFISQFGTNGVVDGGFVSSFKAATDTAGNVYVSDSDPDSASRVQKFNSSGVFQFKFGGPGSADGKFLIPTGVAVDSAGNIYVGDQGNHRIQKFNSSGVFVGKWGSNGTGDNQFDSPMGVAVDSSNDVYVVDSINNRVQKFTSAGTFITKWGSIGSGDGQFSGPQGIAVDSTGTVYVADSGNNRIQKFTSTGTFLEADGVRLHYIERMGDFYERAVDIGHRHRREKPEPARIVARHLGRIFAAETREAAIALDIEHARPGRRQR